jgi:hypothetical protein
MTGCSGDPQATATTRSVAEVELQVGAGFAAELCQVGFRGPFAQRAHGSARAGVLAQELLGELRRDVPQQGQTDIAPQGFLELRAGARVVAADQHHAADLELARQGPRAVDDGRGAGPSAASIEHQHDRRVDAARQIDGPRAVDALPAIEQRPHRDDQREIHVLAPLIEQLVSHRSGVQGRIERPRRPRGDVVGKTPEGQVEAQQDGARGALLTEARQKRTGHEIERGARFDSGQDEARDGHCFVSSILPRRAGRRPA